MKLNLHPLSASSFFNLVKLLLSYKVESKYWPKLIPILGLSLLGSPFRQVSKLQLRRKISKFTFNEDPIFILGHPRSGTTYLHHLMSKDRRFSYMTSYQAWAPELFLGVANNPLIRFLVSSSLPQKRLMDNIELSLDKPEEEAAAMFKISPYSIFNALIFPKDRPRIVDSSVFFQDVSTEEKKLWAKQYVRLLKLASMNMGGKRLLLKSPDNTAKIPMLLELFPNAKFIHIYRNPYVVFISTKHTIFSLSEAFKLQDMPPVEDIENSIFYAYKEVMKRYFEDRHLIPEGNLVEICYEDLEKEPIDNLSKIYTKLDIPDFDQVKSTFIDYTKAKSNYKKNAYNIDPSVLEQIYAHWNFTIDLWGYTAPLHTS